MPTLTHRRKTLVAAMMKQAVYEAAVSVLTEHGTDGLTMDRVALAAGMAKGNLYNYFRSKGSLLQFVCEKTYEPIRQGLDQITGSGQSALHKLESMARMYFAHVAEHRGLFHFLLHDESIRGLVQSEQASMRAKVVADLVAIVQQGIQQGQLRALDPPLVAAMLMGAVRQLGVRQLEQPEVRSVDDTVRDLMEIFLHGIAVR